MAKNTLQKKGIVQSELRCAIIEQILKLIVCAEIQCSGSLPLPCLVWGAHVASSRLALTATISVTKYCHSIV